MQKFKLTILLMVLFSASLQAGSVGTQFSYQGQLVENGAAVSGSYDFQVLLYDSTAGGLHIDLNDIDGVEIIGGLFTLELDFGDAPFNGDQLYLEFRVKPTGAPTSNILMPRQKINPVPYAIQSEFTNDPTSLWTQIGGNLIGYADEVRIGDFNTTTSSALTVDSDVSPVRFKIAGATKFIVRDNGGISIGANTGAPADGLHVQGESRFIGDVEMRGDLKQEVENSGAIKAGVYMFCSNNPSITHFFNGVNDDAITASVGNDAGRCRINFPFELDNRYFMAMYRTGSSANAERRLVTCDQVGGAGSTTLECAVSNVAGTPVNSQINIMVY